MRGLIFTLMLAPALWAPAVAAPAPSLRGTQLDCGGVRFQGVEPVADVGLRRCLDHGLTLEGELTLAEIRALIIDALRAAHRRQIRGQRQPSSKALGAFFDRYLGYREAEAALLAGIPHPVDLKGLRRAQSALEDLQRRWLGAAAEGLMGADNRTRRVALGAPGHPLTSTAPAQSTLAIEIDAELRRWAAEGVPAHIQRARLSARLGAKAAARLAPLIQTTPDLTLPRSRAARRSP